MVVSCAQSIVFLKRTFIWLLDVPDQIFTLASATVRRPIRSIQPRRCHNHHSCARSDTLQSGLSSILSKLQQNDRACLALFFAEQLSSTACHSIAVKTNIQSNLPHIKSTFRKSFVYPRAFTAGSKIFPRHTVPQYSGMTILLPNSCDSACLSTRCYQSTNSSLIP